MGDPADFYDGHPPLADLEDDAEFDRLTMAAMLDGLRLLGLLPPLIDKPKGLHVTDDDSATWALRVLGGLEQRAKRLEKRAAAERMRVVRWLTGELRPIEHRRLVFAAVLEDYARRQGEAGRITVNLPSGKLTYHQGRGAVEVTDGAAFEAWALGNLEAAAPIVTVTITPDKNACRETLTVAPDGETFTLADEIVPGIRWRAAARTPKAAPAAAPDEEGSP